MDATTHFSLPEAARVLEVDEPGILGLARLGGVTPAPGAGGVPGFTFQQLLLLRTTQGLLAAGIPSRRVKRVWASLRRQLAGDLPLSQIRIYADGERAIAWDGTARWQPDSGQFLLDFGAAEIAERLGRESAAPAPGAANVPGPPPAAEPAPAPDAASPAGVERPRRGTAPRLAEIVPFPAARAAAAVAAEEEEEEEEEFLPDADGTGADPALTAEQWFHLGCELEADSPVEARRAYLQALDLDPALADAHLNLGRLEHEAGELGRAEAHYREAARRAPGDPTCHFNLGVLLEDRGRPDEAILAYRQAIQRDPDAADAHYNLGLLLESRGRRSEAMRHLMIARQLYDQASGAE